MTQAPRGRAGVPEYQPHCRRREQQQQHFVQQHGQRQQHW